jgi:tripartite-type tricarboxylate transporter receptor subunit TctC
MIQSTWVHSSAASQELDRPQTKDTVMALRRLALTAGAFAMLAGFVTGSQAEQWPTRTVKVVVPHGLGGIADILARVTADRLSKRLNQNFIIENKVGAGGAIGVDYAVRSPHDGYTILFGANTLFSVLPLTQKVNYVPLKDIIPISITGRNGMVMVVDKDAPYSTLRQFIDYAKAHPGKISYSTGGPAVPNHLAPAYLGGLQGLKMVAVPYGGGQKALTAVLSKDVQMHFGNSSDLIEPIKSGAVKALAVSTAQRIPQLPNVPTVAETVPGFEYLNWNGYAAPGSIPADVKAKLGDTLKAIARDPEIIATLGKLGIESVGTTPEETAESIRKDMPLYAKMVDMAGVRLK